MIDDIIGRCRRIRHERQHFAILHATPFLKSRISDNCRNQLSKYLPRSHMLRRQEDTRVDHICGSPSLTVDDKVAILNKCRMPRHICHVYHMTHITTHLAQTLDLDDDEVHDGLSMNTALTHDVCNILRSRGFTRFGIIVSLTECQLPAAYLEVSHYNECARSLPPPWLIPGIETIMRRIGMASLFASRSYADVGALKKYLVDGGYMSTHEFGNMYVRNPNVTLAWDIQNRTYHRTGVNDLGKYPYSEFMRLPVTMRASHCPVTAPEQWWHDHVANCELANTHHRARVRMMVMHNVPIIDILIKYPRNSEEDIVRMWIDYEQHYAYNIRLLVRYVAMRWHDRIGEPGGRYYHEALASMQL